MLLVLYSNPMKINCYVFITLDFAFLFAYIYIYSCTKAYPDGHHLHRHIDYSGLEGTKGGASVIRRYFADDQLI